MSLLPIDPSLKTNAIPPLTGGLTTTPAKDSECVTFTNMDVARSGWITTRTGTTLAHDRGAIGANPIIGIANLGINDGRLYIVVAKQGYNYYFHVPSTNWRPGLRANFGSFTVPYEGSTARTNFASAFIAGTPGTVPPAGEGEHPAGPPVPPEPPALIGDWDGAGGGGTRAEVNPNTELPLSFSVDTSWGAAVLGLTPP